MALMLALARNVPRAHASLTAGRWERSKLGGSELYEKTLGVLGFGRIGQLVAQRAKGFGMHVVGFDPFVSAERFRELGVEQAQTSDEVYDRADFITLHLPRTDDTRGWLDADAFAKMRDGVRIINCARGELLVDEALKDALDSGKVGGSRARRLLGGADHRPPPVQRLRERRGHAAPGRLDDGGPGPRRRADGRAGGGRAHRRRRLHGGQHPRDRRRGHGGAGPVHPAVPSSSGGSAWRWRRARRWTGWRSSSWAAWPSATRACSRSASCSGYSQDTPRRRSTSSTHRPSPRSEGSTWSRPSATTARDFTDLLRVTVVSGDQARARRRHDDRPPPPSAPARGVGPALQHPARAATSRCSATPTCRAWSAGSARCSATTPSTSSPWPWAASPTAMAPARAGHAAMAITTDAPVARDVLEEIVALDGFVDARSVEVGRSG